MINKNNNKNVVKGLYPESVFDFFAQISDIPRGSKKEEKISNWLVNFAKERNLEVIQDDFLNVIIKKPAFKGYENLSPLIIQGHMDMVWEKNKETNFIFDTQPIELIVKDNFLCANGTTLGADNGIAVAYALAILDSNSIKHPALEILITADEEAGMSGVNGLDGSIFKSKTLLNVDTEEYGEIYVSSAGGSRVMSSLKCKLEKINNTIDSNNHIINIEIHGLNGGHSGADIHKNLGNANVILFDLLYHLSKRFNFNILEVAGGDKTNAIPREANVIINIDLSNSSIEDFNTILGSAFDIHKSNLINIDNRISISSNICDNDSYLYQINLMDTLKLINFMHNYPNGVIKMSDKIENLVETSLNIGVISTIKDEHYSQINIESLLRSSVDESLRILENKLKDLASEYNATFSLDSAYSSWEYNENSKLRVIFQEAFKSLEKKEAKLKAIHAGLECGILVSKIKNLDVISIGPNIYGAHTPEERMDIISVGKTWDLILKALEIYNIED